MHVQEEVVRVSGQRMEEEARVTELEDVLNTNLLKRRHELTHRLEQADVEADRWVCIYVCVCVCACVCVCLPACLPLCAFVCVSDVPLFVFWCMIPACVCCLMHILLHLACYCCSSSHDCSVACCKSLVKEAIPVAVVKTSEHAQSQWRFACSSCVKRELMHERLHSDTTRRPSSQRLQVDRKSR